MAGPLERCLAFLDDRAGVRRLWHTAMEQEIEGGARWAYTLGSTLLVLLISQTITGVLMMGTYTPAVGSAWSSVFYLQHRVTMGWFVRGLHHYGASAVIVVLGLHLLQVLVYGAYKRPREVTWWVGLALFGLVEAMGVTGYLLPWDEKGYWASHVVTNITGSVPVVGLSIERALVGGTQYGQSTLSHLFALHVAALPALIALVLVAHVGMVRRYGRTPPDGAVRTRRDRYFPRQFARDVLIALVAVLILAVLTSLTRGASLDAPADPAINYPPRPEWYFLFLYQALKYVPAGYEAVVTVGLPLVGGLFLFALPLFDTNESRRVRHRAAFITPVALVLVAVVGLTWVAKREDQHDAKYQAARHEADARAARSVALARLGIPPGGPLVMLLDDPMTRGRDLYLQHCTQCHVLEAKGHRKAPDQAGFGSRSFILALLDNPDADHFFGHTEISDMPSQRKLGKAKLQAVTEFLFAQGREPHDPPVDAALVAQGAKVFHHACMKCHTFHGDGDFLAEGGPDMTGYASRTWIRRQIEDPTSPRQYGDTGTMPAFAGQIDDHDLDMLAAFVRQQRFQPALFPKLPPKQEGKTPPGRKPASDHD